MTDVTWLAPDDPRWSEVLARVPHDTYHLPGYARAAAWQEGGRATAFWSRGMGGELLVPLIIRPVPQRPGWFDAVSPYGYPGPLWRGAAGPAQRAHWAAFEQACLAERLVSVFLRLHPFLSSAADPAQVPGTHVMHGDIYAVDLRHSDDEYQRHIRKSHRRLIRRLEHAGFQIVMDDWTHFSGFLTLYGQTMRRLQASRYYHLSPDYFATLRRELPEHLHLISAVDPTGRLAAAGLLLSCGGAVHCHLGGVDEPFVTNNPTRLIDAQTVRLLRAQGRTLLNLGGGLGGENDSLAEYKRGFATHTYPYATCRVVVNPAAYAQFSAAAGHTAFFPAYRAPTMPPSL
ncbi:GNAT family N-acetyltransferase [Deinococcus radiotolerans]|uniref:BioF2-like acetyltransferase domain-containing protein n=1 Tax=Deinococcus radiotolerans TaxID=1309407 RepID=A0ABQ2FLJ1_9DEIO|nr:GNAT family N-acetyltransferase [Deinococcus radiotolerans]GGL09597.1 hypothetical protein GCM10010844_30360 [Deinococcus radiotolerans]